MAREVSRWLRIALLSTLLHACERPQQVRTEEGAVHAPVTEVERRVTLAEAREWLGMSVPLPRYLPDRYTLDGIHVYGPESGDRAVIRRGIYLTFRGDRDWLLLRFYGGDTRSTEVRANTGGDLPADFALAGRSVSINGSEGSLQDGLESVSYLELGRIVTRARLIWRVPWRSREIDALSAIFLTLEHATTDEDLPISPDELVRVAASIEHP